MLVLLIFISFILQVSANPLVFELTKGECPETHRLIDTLCIDLGFDYDLKADSAPAHAFLPHGLSLKYSTAHYVRLVATAKGSDNETIGVSNAPVHFFAAERDQLIYQLDPISGELVRKVVKVKQKHTLFTNSAGVASFFIEFASDAQLLTQRILVSAAFIDNNQMRYIQADQGAFKLLQNVKEQDILKMKPDFVSKDAENLATAISLVSTFILEHQTDSEISLDQVFPTNLDAFDEFDDMTDSLVLGLKIVVDATGKALVAIVAQGTPKVLKFTIKTVQLAFKVLLKMLQVSAISLYKIVTRLSPSIDWNAVTNTQIHFMNALEYTHEQAYSLVDNNREKIIERMRSTTGSLESQVDKALDFLRKKVPSVPSVTDPSALAISDIIDANADRVEAVATAKQVSTITSRLDALEQLGIPQVNVLVLATRNALEREGKDLLRGLLTGIRGLISVFGTVATTAVDEAILLFNLVHDLFWDVLNLSVKVPFVSSWFRRVIAKNKYDMSMIGLLTIAPSILYAGNHRYEPTPVLSPSPRMTRPLRTSIQLVKYAVAIYLMYHLLHFFSLYLGMWISFWFMNLIG